MKNFKKLIPVALGLLTLASCSDDSFFSEKTQQGDIKLEKGEMLVTIDEPQEDGTAFTRGYTSRDMKQRRWWSGVDRLRVYGSQFGAFDTYEFQQGINETSGKFKIVSSPSYVGEPKWALFPYDDVSDGKWEQSGGLWNSTSSVKVALPQVITYDAALDANNPEDTQPYYLDNLPRFGEVTSINNGEYLSTKLNWLTAILRLQLAGTPTYANGIKVQLQEAGDPAKTLAVNGKPTVVIAHNDAMIAEGASISASDIKARGYVDAANVDKTGSLYVYIPDKSVVDKSKSVIYLPLPVWNKQVDIVIYTATDYDGAKNGGTATWTEYTRLKNKTIALGKVYGNKNEYNLAIDGTNPEAISDALDLIETDEETITLVATNGITVCKANNFTTIEIPNKEGVKDIIIDLTAQLDGCTADETLNIVYKNSNDKFKGNVTLITNTTSTEPVKLNVDLDESGFAIVGGGALQQTNPGDIDIDADEFVVGNTNSYTQTELKAIALKFSNNVKSLTIAKEGKLIGDFKIDQTTNPNPEDWKFGAVEAITVNGKVTGNINALANTKPDFATNVVVEGEEACNGSNLVVYNIRTRGTVTVNAGKDGNVATISDIEAEKAVCATGYVTISGDVSSEDETVNLSGHVEVTTGDVTAKKEITIVEQASVLTGDITSEEGESITINNEFEADTEYKGAIEATNGSVYLNEAGSKVSTFSGGITAKVDAKLSGNVAVNTDEIKAGQDVELSGKATVDGVKTTAGRDFKVIEEASTNNDVDLKRAATVNITTNGGDAEAVGGTMTFADGADYALNLLNGCVNKVDATAGSVALTFSESPALTAIKTVTTANNLLPQNKSIWNGVQLSSLASYAFDTTNDAIWTATQLAYLLQTPRTSIILRSDIDLNNEEWEGIKSSGSVTMTGLLDNTKTDAYWQKKTISNLNLTNPSDQKIAGFFAKVAGTLNISNIDFNSVKTTFDDVTTDAMVGVGAVVGTANMVNMTRINAILAGGKFGAKDADSNKKSQAIGGLIGSAIGEVKLNGVTVDATNAALSGYCEIGGFIGKASAAVTIQMAAAINKLASVKSKVTGLAMNITFVDTNKENDLKQGMTGLYIGSALDNVTINNLNNVVNDAFTATGERLDLAIKIISTTKKLYFSRGDQTLIGHNGAYAENDKDYLIDGETYQIYEEGAAAPVNYVPGNKHLYNLTLHPYND